MIAWLLGTRVGRFISGAVAALALFAGAFLAGRREGAQNAAHKRKDDYIKTRKDMDDAEIHGDDPNAAAAWLRERQQRRDM